MGSHLFLFINFPATTKSSQGNSPNPTCAPHNSSFVRPSYHLDHHMTLVTGILTHRVPPQRATTLRREIAGWLESNSALCIADSPVKDWVCTPMHLDHAQYLVC